VGLGGAKRSIAVTKRYAFNKKNVRVAYGVQNRSDTEATFWFGVELNTSLGTDVVDGIEATGAETVQVDPAAISHDAGTPFAGVSKLTIKTLGALKTVSVSSLVPGSLQAAMVGDTARQGVSMLLLWPVTIAADQTWRTEIVLSVHE
jgi:hypothetical protein